MDKRGQFFLIAALVIAGIVITLSVMNITIKAPEEDVTLYDLSSEIDYESSQLIDHGIYYSYSEGEISSSVISLMANYSYAYPNTDIVAVFGDENSVTELSYEKINVGSLGIGTGSTSGLTQIQIEPVTRITYPEGEEKKIEVKLNAIGENSTVSFNLKSGQNFFLILKRTSGGQTNVVQG